MKINIAASHRFHLLDLARELSNLGHDVRFYSYVPTSRAVKFGLKRDCSHSLIVPMLPFLALIKLSKGAYWTIKLGNRVLDSYLSWFMRPCDVYIALGTVYEKSFSAAKQKFGACTILEWGSKHIEEQQRIMSEIPSVKQQPKYFTQRTLRGYAIADYIAIAADHVKQSFIEKGVAESKLLQNPYGVDISMFKPTALVKDDVYDLIMVGGWSYRKGCDLLTSLFTTSNYKFLHVGPIVDLEFPRHENMTHVDAVDQRQLINFYSRAKVFVLPSREEGLAMVQAQAIACGLQVVCSRHTGGRDLRNFLKEDDSVIEMQEYTIEELSKCISKALEIANSKNGIRSHSNDFVKNISWCAYGERYDTNLRRQIS